MKRRRQYHRIRTFLSEEHRACREKQRRETTFNCGEKEKDGERKSLMRREEMDGVL